MCPSSTKWWLLAILIVAALLAAPIRGQNPLDPAPQAPKPDADCPAVDPNQPVEERDAYTGTFTDGKLTLVLAKHGANYDGTVTLNAATYPAVAQLADNKVSGSFSTADGKKFDFALDATVDGLDLTTGSAVYHLKTEKRARQDAQNKQQQGIPAGKFDLKFGYAPGTYQGEFQMQADTVSNTGAGPIEMSQASATAWTLQVRPSESDGRQKCFVTVRQAKLTLKAMGQFMEWDSSRAPDPTFQQSFMFAVLLNNPIEVTLSANKRVDEVKGIDEAVKRIAAMNEDAGLFASSQKSAARETIEAIMMTQLSTLFPEKPVGPNDEWQASVSVNLPQAPGTRLPGRATLSKVQGRLGQIDFTGTAEPQAGDAVGAFKLTSESHNAIDIPTGMVLGSEGKMTIHVASGRSSSKTTVNGSLRLQRMGE
jgi:hypothetical protein